MIVFEVNQRTYLASVSDSSITIYDQDFEVILTSMWQELSIPIVYDREVKFVGSSYGSRTTTFLVRADGKIYTVKFDPTAGNLQKIAEIETSDSVVLPAKLRSEFKFLTANQNEVSVYSEKLER